MTGRPPTLPGAWGKVSVERTGSGAYQAETRYRHFSGRVTRLRARGTSASAARSALIERLQTLNQVDGSDADITRRSTIIDLAAFWLAEKEAEGVQGTSLRTYRSTVNNQIVPVIGERRLGECRTSVIDRVIKNQAASGKSITLLRKCLHQMFQLAVRHDAISANPVLSVARIGRPKKEIEFLTPGQAMDVRALIDDAMRKSRERPGPNMTGDLRDIVDLMLNTGCRIGEVLGLVYAEINLTDESIPLLTVSGTVVTETGKGTYRKPRLKSDAGYRTLTLPDEARDIILRRMVEKPGNPLDAVFATRNGTWFQVSNVENTWNRVVDGTSYDWVTFHVFRKSVATLIDRSVDAKSAAAQLGHSSEQVTQAHYIHKPQQAPDLRAHLDAFRRR